MTHLKQIECGRVQEVEGNKIQDPAKGFNEGLPSEIPKCCAIVSVIDEIHHCQHGERQTNGSKDHTIGTCPNGLLSCTGQ